MPADRAEIGPAQLGWRWALRGSQQDATRPFWALFLVAGGTFFWCASILERIFYSTVVSSNF
jgi:hypothetical protein